MISPDGGIEKKSKSDIDRQIRQEKYYNLNRVMHVDEASDELKQTIAIRRRIYFWESNWDRKCRND